MQCAGCSQVIADRFVYRVQEQVWHGTCIRCVQCRATLTERCFSRDGKFFCKNDFYRTYGAKCFGCREGISPEDLVRRAGKRVYHIGCFKCTACDRLLDTGQRYAALGDYELLCSCSTTFVTQTTGGAGGDVGGDRKGADDEKTATAPNDEMTVVDDSGPSEKSDEQRDCDDGSTSTKEPTSAPSSSEGRRRGPRTTIKAKQLDMLKTAFDQNPKPSRPTREKLAKSTGLTMRVIQVWFQNRRSKERRLKQLDELAKPPGTAASPYQEGQLFQHMLSPATPRLSPSIYYKQTPPGYASGPSLLPDPHTPDNHNQLGTGRGGFIPPLSKSFAQFSPPPPTPSQYQTNAAPMSGKTPMGTPTTGTAFPFPESQQHILPPVASSPPPPPPTPPPTHAWQSGYGDTAQVGTAHQVRWPHHVSYNSNYP